MEANSTFSLRLTAKDIIFESVESENFLADKRNDIKIVWNFYFKQTEIHLFF